MKQHNKCWWWNTVLVLLKNHVFQITMSILTLLPHFSTSKMGTTLNISAYSMKGVTMKWFDFDEILKCSGGKRLLKSYVENKLKPIKKIELFLHIFFSKYLLIHTFSLQEFFRVNCLYCLSFLGSCSKKRFLLTFAPIFSHICTIPIPGMNLTLFTLDFIIYCSIAILVFPSSTFAGI